MKQKLLNNLRLRAVWLVAMILCAVTGAWADDYSYTFQSKQFSSNNDAQTLDAVSWTLAGDGGYWGYDGTKGQQFGSGSKPYKSLTLTTSDISGTITNIVVYASTASSASATISCTVGNSDFGTQSQSMSTSPTNYTFSGSASGEIVISMSQSTSKALYIKSIAVTYTTGGGDTPTTYSVTYNANGATSGDVPSDDNEYEEGDKVTVLGNTGSLAKTGCAFGGWNTQANGEGDSYDENDIFEITANTKLYAQWIPYTITAASNNDSYGTVSLSGSVITATPATGYTYASPAYSVSPANSATVAQDGNTFTVTPTADTEVTINFEALPTYTVTFGDGGSVAQETPGAEVTLPSRSAISSYTFAGWSETNVTSETTTAPTIIPAGSYTPTANITLYPVYSKTEGGGGTVNKSASVNISTYATSNSWTSGTQYKDISLDENVTATANGGGNTGKYYSTNNSWRLYANETATLVIALAKGTLTSVTITYTGNKLTYNAEDITSGTSFGLSGNSATIAVSGSSSNSQVTAISVDYTISGGGTTYYWSAPVAATVERPEIVVAQNPFLFSTTATITCETEGAAIKYSYDNENWNNYTEALTITATTTIYAKAVKSQDESSVASVTATKNLAEPTVSIDATGITNTNVYTDTEAGSLAASVTYNDAAIDGATVTWSGNNDAVATINASTGAVTLVGAGSVTFTATYAGNSDYSDKTATYVMTVTSSDPNAPGTVNNPYTVAQARAAIDAGTGVTGVYATGIVSQIVTAYNSQFGNISYNISVDGETTSDQLQAYRGFDKDGDWFTSADDVQVGDVVVIYGNLKKYNSTYEFDQNNQLYSLVRKPVAPTFSPEAGAVVSGTEVALSTTTEDAVIYYTLDGSVPTTSSTEYTEAIEITEATTIKAIAVKNDVSSDVSTATYTIEAQITRINAENVNLASDATSGEIDYTISYPIDNVTLTASCTAEWISNIAVTADKVTFTTTANTAYSPREANITLSYTGAENKVITVTQARFVLDYATLPFDYDGNGSELPIGLTQSGLGTYASSPAMKFDGTGDVLVLKIKERPGTLTFDIKGNSFSDGTFKVQTSADGENYTDLASYTALDNTQKEKFTNLGENVRYIKWVYTNKVSGNVALGNISLAKYSYNPSIALSTEAVEVDAEEHDGTITVSYNQITNVVSQVYFCNAEGESATYNWIEAEINNSNNVDYVIGENTSTEARTAYFKVYAMDDETNLVYSDLVTVTQAGKIQTTTYTLANSITPGKRYIIANGSNVAMGVQNSNNRAAVDVTITEGTIKLAAGSGVQEFVIYGPDANGYYSIYDETEEEYLYAASSGSNHLKTQGTNDANGRWSIEIDNESSVATITAQGDNTHNWMRYNSSSKIFSCYGSNSNQGDIYLYESEEDAVVTNVKVQLNDKGFATYASDKTLDFLNADASFSAWQVTGVSGSTIQFEQIESTVASGKGIMLMGSANAEITINILPAGGETLSGNKLEGITEATEVAADTYFGLKGNKFVKVNAGTIAAGKAVLPVGVLPVLPAGVKSLTFNFNGVPTGVNGVETVDAENARIFNLAGQRLSAPQKGLNIVNGKKVLVK